MTLVVLSATGFGLGVCGAAASLRVRGRPTLAAVIRGLTSNRHDLTVAPGTARPHRWRIDGRVGQYVATSLRQRGRLTPRLRVSLNLAGWSFEDLCTRVVLGGVVGLLLPPLCSTVVDVGGVHVPVAVPVWASIAMGAGGGLLAFAALGAEAKRGRRATRRAMGAFLDLVVLGLAGGMGIESALLAAADVSDNPTCSRIASALVLARDTGEPPWDALAALGEQFGTTEFQELAAAVSLAGNEGARIRSTLSAKAASIRRHELAEAEAEANAVTERLFLPAILLLVGFLLFIGYPAYVRIVSGL